MNIEKGILQLANYYEKFEAGASSAYLIINENMKDYKAMFGFAELGEDKEEWKEIFSRMEDKAKEMGYSSLVGPLNYCTWMSYRWAISRFDMKLFPDCTNPPFYPEYIKELGYRELYTYRSAEIAINNPLNEVGEQVYSEKKEEGYSFITVEKEEAFAYVKEIDISLIVAFHGEEAIGYVFGYENRYGKDFISKTSAVKKEYQKQKIYLSLLYLGSELVKNKGYDTMLYHFQCEQKETFRRFGEDVENNEKRYAVYVKEL